MNRSEALQYVGHAVDDSLNVRTGETIPDNAIFVGWQCGFEPMFVAVWSYLQGCTVDADDAVSIAEDYLSEIGWFTANDIDPAYYIIC